MQYTCIPCLLSTQQSELGMQVDSVGGLRGGCHCSVVGTVLSFLIPALFLSRLQVLEMKLYSNFSPYVSVLPCGCSELTFKHNLFHLHITLHTNAFIASDEIVCATHL